MFILIKVIVKFTFRLAVYRQSVRLGAKPLEAHDQSFSSSLFFYNWTLDFIVLM
jgi:hypothetical protein